MTVDVQAHIRVYGIVQGVFYRMNILEQARTLGIRGWVRNRQDGTVEAVFQGNKQVVDKIIQYCQQGPPSATVINVKVQWIQPDPTLHSFDILGTV